MQAKRLSASKVTNLTNVAMKLMEVRLYRSQMIRSLNNVIRLQEDTQLVSILYRTHKSLSSSAKISSLYVFDALARAAKHQVNKQNLTGNINSPKGNCATFLLRVEGILEGLFKEMIAAKSPESKVSGPWPISHPVDPFVRLFNPRQHSCCLDNYFKVRSEQEHE